MCHTVWSVEPPCFESMPVNASKSGEHNTMDGAGKQDVNRTRCCGNHGVMDKGGNKGTERPHDLGDKELWSSSPGSLV